MGIDAVNLGRIDLNLLLHLGADRLGRGQSSHEDLSRIGAVDEVRQSETFLRRGSRQPEWPQHLGDRRNRRQAMGRPARACDKR